MRTIKLATTFALVAVVLADPQARTAQQPDAASIIAAARQALGGDAALLAVKSFAITGSLVGNVAAAPASCFETICELPDKFLRVSRRKLGPPGSTVADVEVTDYDGFVGGRFIRETVAPGAPFPMTAPRASTTTPEDRVRRVFLHTVLPLFASVPASAGIDMTSAGKASLAKGQADVLELRRADGAQWRLLIDDTTHLPATLTWQAKPPVTGIMSVTTDSRGNQLLGPMFTPPSTAGLPNVTWALAISDYKMTNGLNWPRRFKTSHDGKSSEDMTFNKFTINPKIDPKRFEIKK